MRKRIMAFLLVAVMTCVNLCMAGASEMLAYAEDDNIEEAGISIKAVEEVKAGELVTIEVVANKDMYWNACELKLNLNPEKLVTEAESLKAIPGNYNADNSEFKKWCAWNESAYKGSWVANYLEDKADWGPYCYHVSLVGVSSSDPNFALIKKGTTLLSLKAKAEVDLKAGDVIATCTLPIGYVDDRYGEYDPNRQQEIGLSVECKVVEIPKVTITFETNGGNVIQPIEIVKSTVAVVLQIPVKEGYMFDGWYTDSTCETEFDETVPVETDITLYAKWEKEIPINMNDFVIEDGTLKKYTGKAAEVAIPEGVTKIDSGAFEGCGHVTSIRIPASVAQIDRGGIGASTLSSWTEGKTTVTGNPQCTFSDCSGLQTIRVAKGNKEYVAYKDCLYEKYNILNTDYKLGLICCPAQKEQVNFPDNTKWIDGGAFYGCSKLKNIHIPESVTGIGDYAFWECSSLESIEIPEDVNYIGIGVFFGCSNLKSVHIPDSVKGIGSFAFYGCSKLSDIHIPEKVQNIEYAAFYNCESLKSITIPDGVTSIGMNTFSGCNVLEEIVIPESVTSIRGGAFYGTKWLEEQRKANPFVIVNHILIDGNTNNYDKKNVIIPDGVTCIGEGAFNGIFGGFNSYKTRVTLPDSVTEICSYAFGNCKNLVRVNIPKSVVKIDKDAFHTYGGLNLTIYGEEGSYAQEFANTNQIPFRLSDSEEDVITSEEMEKLVEKNKTDDVTVETASGVTFIFKKGSLDNAEITDAIDFGATISQDYGSLPKPSFTESEFAFQINYNHEGQLPGEAKISIPVDNKWIGKRLYYYEVGPNGEYKYMGRTTVAKDGTYTVTQNHCSSYVATTKAPEKLGDANDDGKITSEDALAVLKYDVKIAQDNFVEALADCDGEDGITSSDALAILKYDVKLQDKFY